jgi:hypothetical protein
MWLVALQALYGSAVRRLVTIVSAVAARGEGAVPLDARTLSGLGLRWWWLRRWWE